MPILPLLLALAAATAPVPGPIKTFGDWEVACDNGHACEMTSLFPGEDGAIEEGSGYDGASLSVARSAGPAGSFTVSVQLGEARKDMVSLRIDGAVVAQGMVRDDSVDFGGETAARIVAAIPNGKELLITDAGGKMIGKVSLSGSSAALRFIDADQGRAGTVTAAVAKGPKAATAVPPAAALPVVRQLRPSGKALPGNPLRAALNKISVDCAEVYEGSEGAPPEIYTFALGGGKTLALLPCGSGAYNYSSIPFLLTAGGKPVIAPFDSLPGDSEDGMAMLTNASFENGRLGSYSKGRGIGDCGVVEDYAWDGTMFRLVETRMMPECRGSIHWLTVWRANAVVQ